MEQTLLLHSLPYYPIECLTASMSWCLQPQHLTDRPAHQWFVIPHNHHLEFSWCNQKEACSGHWKLHSITGAFWTGCCNPLTPKIIPEKCGKFLMFLCSHEFFCHSDSENILLGSWYLITCFSRLLLPSSVENWTQRQLPTVTRLWRWEQHSIGLNECVIGDIGTTSHDEYSSGLGVKGLEDDTFSELLKATIEESKASKKKVSCNTTSIGTKFNTICWVC